MKIRKIITSGCSFSDPKTPYTWPNQLENYVKRIDPTVRFDHRGLASQGQELIQKKASHAIFEALETGYKPEELAVFVMWSSVDRKSFYIDNPYFIEEIVNNWKLSTQGWTLQFGDLKNDFSSLTLLTTLKKNNNEIMYNKNGGWLITSAHVTDEIKFVRDYFMMAKEVDAPGPNNTSLENILLLQYLCKSKNIKLYQQFYMDNILESHEKCKDHQIVKYLYNDLDRSTFISEKSMHSYMNGREELFVGVGNNHPNGLGHRIWTNEVILPHIENDNFFE